MSRVLLRLRLAPNRPRASSLPRRSWAGESYGAGGGGGLGRQTTNAWKSKGSGTGLNTIVRHPRGPALSSVGSPEASEMGKESDTCIFSGLTELSALTRPPLIAKSDPLHKTCAVPVVSVATVTAADRKT